MKSITNTFWLSPRICCNGLIWLALCSTTYSVSARAAPVTTETTVIPEERVEKTDSSKSTDTSGGMNSGAKTAIGLAVLEPLAYWVSRYAATHRQGYVAGNVFSIVVVQSAPPTLDPEGKLGVALGFGALALARMAIPEDTPEKTKVWATFISINVVFALLDSYDYREQDSAKISSKKKWAFNYAPEPGGGQLIFSRSF